MARARENVFSSEKPYFVRYVGDPAEKLLSLVDRCVSTLTNPVEAGLVRRAKEWPGATSDAEVREVIRAKVRENEAEVLERHQKEGKPFVGAAAVRAQSRLHKPSTPHGKGIKDVKPTVAAHSTWHAIAAKQQIKEFRIRYRKALKRWKAGDRTVVFPYGKWRMARYFGDLVEDAWSNGIPRPPDSPPPTSGSAAA